MNAIIAILCLFFATAGFPTQAADQVDSIQFSVTLLNPAELPPDTSREWLNFLEPGIASGALGVVAPPMYASGLIVGGLLLAPGSVVLSSMEHKKWLRVADALKKIEFKQRLLQALHTRAARELSPLPQMRVELAVEAYGVVSKRSDKACFIAIADMTIMQHGKEAIRNRLSITATNRSADAPPVQCASLDRFAGNDGELVRDTAAEYIEILAIMTMDRIRNAAQQ